MPETSDRRDRGVPRRRSRGVAVLDGIRVSWEWLCAPPHPVTIDGAPIAGLPDGRLPLDEVRARLLDRGCPLSVRDAVWAHLIGRSRVDGPTWTVACAGMALPMLAAVYRELSGGPGVDRDDLSSAVVTGFVAALAYVDVDRPGLATSLRWSAFRAGHAVLREQRRAPIPVGHARLVAAALATPTHAVILGRYDTDHGTGLAPTGHWESAPPPTVGGHPDLVLADAVADGVLSRAEAVLIGETRLEATTLAQAAARRGRTVGAVTMQRLRAEMRLVDHILTPHHPDPEPSTHTPATSGRPAAEPGRGRPPRPRTVTGRTGQQSRAARPPAPPCGPERSPSVNTARRRRRGPARGCAAQVTR